MALEKKIPGELLYLFSQLGDGNTTALKRVFVRLRDPFGQPLPVGLIELVKVSEGLFVEKYDPLNDTRQVMPDLDHVTAHYFVMDDDGLREPDGSFTTPFAGLQYSCDHSFDVDKYKKDVIAILIKDRLDQKISSIDNNPSDLFGQVDVSGDIFGHLDDSGELSGTIESTLN